MDDSLAGSTIDSVEPQREPVRVPASRYTSEEFARAEMDHVWPKTWQVACSVDHVANPGDYFEYTVGTLSVLIVRNVEGELRAYQNVCLHRGNELCNGSGAGLTELRCPFHRWAWTLDGELREVPSRKGFGALRNADYPLIPVQVDTWARLVWINLDIDVMPLVDYLDDMPADVTWADLDEFRCVAQISTVLDCNWKVLIDGFSETYHVQGIHPEMLPMVDDINSPQIIWNHVGKLEQPYGLPSPRLREVTPQQVWEGFVEVMGARAGIDDAAEAGPVPDVPAGQYLRDVIAEMIKRHSKATKGVDLSRFETWQLMNMQQFNVFPNVTILVFADMLQVVKARPGSHPGESIMDVIAFDRSTSTDAEPTTPVTMTWAKEDFQMGLVLTQDVANIEKAQRGLYQPGFTHLSLSGEECRIINLHRNLDAHIPAGER